MVYTIRPTTPTTREQLTQRGPLYRNLAATDIFERVEIQALHGRGVAPDRQYRPKRGDTSPGFLKGRAVGSETNTTWARRGRDGLAKLHQCGTARWAMSLHPRTNLEHVPHWSGPGDGAAVSGRSAEWSKTSSALAAPICIATLSHGYGVSVTPRNGACYATDRRAGGVKRPISSSEGLAGRCPGVQASSPKWLLELGGS